VGEEFQHNSGASTPRGANACLKDWDALKIKPEIARSLYRPRRVAIAALTRAQLARQMLMS
jgi:hypothetical protein